MATKTKLQPKSEEPQEGYATQRGLVQHFKIPLSVWQKMRWDGRGPKFRRVSYKTVIYKISDVEAWLATLPKGGGKG